MAGACAGRPYYTWPYSFHCDKCLATIHGATDQHFQLLRGLASRGDFVFPNRRRWGDSISTLVSAKGRVAIGGTPQSRLETHPLECAGDHFVPSVLRRQQFASADPFGGTSAQDGSRSELRARWIAGHPGRCRDRFLAHRQTQEDEPLVVIAGSDDACGFGDDKSFCRSDGRSRVLVVNDGLALPRNS